MTTSIRLRSSMGSQRALPAISLLFPHLLAPREVAAELRLKSASKTRTWWRAGVLALALFVRSCLAAMEPVPQETMG